MADGGGPRRFSPFIHKRGTLTPPIIAKDVDKDVALFFFVFAFETDFKPCHCVLSCWLQPRENENKKERLKKRKKRERERERERGGGRRTKDL